MTTPQPMSEKIITAACMYFKITEDVLISKELNKDTVYKRQLCYYLLKEDGDISFCAIGRRFQHFGHNAAYKGHDKIAAHKNIYTQVRHDLANIRLIAGTLL
jgi:chromosomal replication initiation ATPase DnaA